MSPGVIRSLFFPENDRRRTDRSRNRRRCGIGLELLEGRITPTGVTGLSPAAGALVGGNLVTITGTGFTGVTAVDFGAIAATNLTVLSATTLTVDSPAGTGTVDVTVITPGGTSGITAADEFAYVAAPSVSGLSENIGPASGGTIVTITGTGFTNVTAIDFGAVPTSSLTVVNPTTITALSPAGTGTVDVSVTTLGGKSAASAADVFTYAPTISAISPAAGSSGGGTLLTITGTGFIGVSAVDFGTTPAMSFTVASASTIEALSPPGTGAVGVTVTTRAARRPICPPMCSLMRPCRWFLA
jgi:IPT/TIG domain